MSSTSPLIVDPAVFAPSAISAESHAFNQKLMEIMSTGPKWYEVLALPPPPLIVA